MAIPVTCPSCRFEGEAPDETVGQTVLCPECRSNIPVPDPKANRVRQRPPSDRPSHRPRDDDDDDYDDDRPSRRRGGRRGGMGSVCRFCGSDAPPYVSSQISAAGWIMFAILFLVGCWPFFIIGLFMKEDIRKCSECGAKL